MDSKKKHHAAAALRKQVANRHAAEAEQAVSAHILAERKRCAGLMALSEQAARLRVSFDADAAILGRISLQAARNKVMHAAADGDAPETSPYSGQTQLVETCRPAPRRRWIKRRCGGRHMRATGPSRPSYPSF